MPFCPYCGSEMKEDHRFCRNCGREIEGKVAVGPEPIPAKPSSQPNVWAPVLWLVAIVLSGFFVGLIGGLFITVLASIWVYRSAKTHGLEVWTYTVCTLLVAIVGLPLYAYELHKLRGRKET